MSDFERNARGEVIRMDGRTNAQLLAEENDPGGGDNAEPDRPASAANASGPAVRVRFRRVCAWHKPEPIVLDGLGPIMPGEQVTHGICEDCLAEARVVSGIRRRRLT